MIHISKKKWRRTNRLDLNNSSRWEENSKGNQNICQISMIKVMFQGKRGLNIQTTMLFQKGSFKETQATRILILKKKWKRINNLDLSSNLKWEANSKDSQSTYLIFMIKDMLKEGTRLHYLTTRSCQKEISKETQVIMIHISKKKWKKISSSDLSNNSR